MVGLGNHRKSFMAPVSFNTLSSINHQSSSPPLAFRSIFWLANYSSGSPRFLLSMYVPICSFPQIYFYFLSRYVFVDLTDPLLNYVIRNWSFLLIEDITKYIYLLYLYQCEHMYISDLIVLCRSVLMARLLIEIRNVTLCPLHLLLYSWSDLSLFCFFRPIEVGFFWWENQEPRENEKLYCLIPAPKEYVTPLSWPKSIDYVPYANAPNKAIQGWI